MNFLTSRSVCKSSDYSECRLFSSIKRQGERLWCIQTHCSWCGRGKTATLNHLRVLSGFSRENLSFSVEAWNVIFSVCFPFFLCAFTPEQRTGKPASWTTWTTPTGPSLVSPAALSSSSSSSPSSSKSSSHAKSTSFGVRILTPPCSRRSLSHLTMSSAPYGAPAQLPQLQRTWSTWRKTSRITTPSAVPPHAAFMTTTVAPPPTPAPLTCPSYHWVGEVAAAIWALGTPGPPLYSRTSRSRQWQCDLCCPLVETAGVSWWWSTATHRRRQTTAVTWTMTWKKFPPPAIAFHTMKRQYSGQYPLISDEERTIFHLWCCMKCLYFYFSFL